MLHFDPAKNKIFFGSTDKLADWTSESPNDQGRIIDKIRLMNISKDFPNYHKIAETWEKGEKLPKCDLGKEAIQFNFNLIIVLKVLRHTQN